MSPLALVEAWLDRAIQLAEPLADSMCLATIADDGAPDSRMVRARALDRRGLVFFTDRRSPKARQIHANPLGSAVFFWPTLRQQIRIAGRMEEVPAGYADGDFESKSQAQRAAIACFTQSAQIGSYRTLEDQLARSSTASPLTRPEHWIGFLLVPRRVEFFIARRDRPNRRLECVRQASGRWIARSLAS